MDGLFHGKPYEQMDDLGVSPCFWVDICVYILYYIILYYIILYYIILYYIILYYIYKDSVKSVEFHGITQLPVSEPKSKIDWKAMVPLYLVHRGRPKIMEYLRVSTQKIGVFYPRKSSIGS